jgi:hypothetical protein
MGELAMQSSETSEFMIDQPTSKFHQAFPPGWQFQTILSVVNGKLREIFVGGAQRYTSRNPSQ